MIAQLIITLILFAVAAFGCFMFWRTRKNQKPDELQYTQYTMESLLEHLKRRAIEATRMDNTIAMSNSTYKVLQANKERMEEALTACIDGIASAREIVIAFVRDIIKTELLTEEDCCRVKDFRAMDFMTPMEKWEILIYVLSKEQEDPIGYLQEVYDLTQIREIILDDGRVIKKRELDAEWLDEIFSQEVTGRPEVMDNFGYNDMMYCIARELYSQYKGFDILDTLYYLKVDGFEFGTSGSVRFEIEGRWDDKYRSVNSVWVQINAQWIHFSFFDFGSQNRMRRLALQLTAYGNVAPMTELMPVKVTDAPNGARITAFGKPVGESWAVFVRKFNLSIYTLEFLLNKPYAENYQLCIKVMYFLLKANFNMPVTGQQNTGKTTLMKALIELCDLMNIRVIEMSFELALREIYPWMNIFTAKPTNQVDNTKIQDTFKKTDGAMSMYGEIAENILIPGMIQFARVASQKTMFSSHHKTDQDLIYGLADGWMEYSNIERDAAISAILDVIKCNVHMDFSGTSQNRVLAFISEIVKENELQDYPAISLPHNAAEAIYQQTVIDREYYTRRTDRIKFTSRKIVVYDEEQQKYVPNDWFTDETVRKILIALEPADREAFIEMANTEFAEVRKIRKQKDAEHRKLVESNVMQAAKMSGNTKQSRR